MIFRIPGVAAMPGWMCRPLLIALGCLLASLLAATEAEPVTGPITVIRGSGQPCAVVRQVILPTPATDYTLRVDNDAAHPVTSADIRVGTQTVVSERDFTAGVTRIEKPVTAGGAVEIGALLRGAPGSTLRISLIQTCCWTTVVFGPERFNRTNGSPNVYTRTIAGPVGPAILRLVNGDGQNANEVSSATITIDGQQAFTPSQFNQQVHTLSTPITLKASSTLRVELRSTPGSYLTLSVLTQDCRPLSAAFSAATSAATEGGAQPTIAVTLNRPNPQPVVLAVAITGGTATPGSDATLGSANVTIPAGATSVPVPVTVIDDALTESEETLILTLRTNGSGGGCSGGDGHCDRGRSDGHDSHGCDHDALRNGGRCTSGDGRCDRGRADGHDGHGCDQDRRRSDHDDRCSGGDGHCDRRRLDGHDGHGCDHDSQRNGGRCAGGDGRCDRGRADGHDGHGCDHDRRRDDGGSCGGGSRGVTIGTPSTHTLTIHDNDHQQTPTVAFAIATSSVGEAAAPMTVIVALSQASSSAMTVPITVSGTATIGTDLQTIPASISIPAGSTSATITVAPINDTVTEGNETVVLTLGAPTGATLGAITTHTAIIIDDDATPVVRFAAATSQVDEAGSPLAILVQLDHASVQAVAVPLSIAGTATTGSDYQALAAAVSIPAGSTSATFTLTPIDDQITEGNETVIITLGVPTNATLGTPATHTATIVDDDAAPVIRFTAAASQVGEAGGALAIQVVLNHASVQAVTVPLSIGGTATPGADFQALPASVAIPAGSTSATITLTPVDDQIYEGDETVAITLGAPTNATLGTPATHTATLIDNDVVPVLRFVQATSSISEAGGAVAVTVQLDHAAAMPISATLGTSGTATSGSDVQAVVTTVTIPAGAVSGAITITPIDDLVHEVDETVVLTLSAPVSATLGAPAVHILTILDNDPLPTVTFAATSSSVGEAAAARAVTVNLSQVTTSDVTVVITTSGTASAGSDYQAVAASLTIPAGMAGGTVQMAPVDDQIHEGDETVVLTISAPMGATLGTQTVHTVTIVDDDPVPVLRFSQAASTVGEGDGAIAITVQLDRPTVAAVTAAVAVSGTATAGSDYQAVAVTLSIPAGATSGTVSVTPVEDQIHEGDETVLLTLANPAGATLGTPASHTLSIVDNDPVPAVAFAAAASSVGEAAGPDTIHLVLDRPSVTAITIPLTITGSATSGTDYLALPATVTVPAGATSATLALTPMDDPVHEGDETVIIALGAPSGATRGAIATHTATIVDNDAIPSLSFGPALAGIGEGDAPVAIAVRLTNPTTVPVTATLQGLGTATSSTDYQALPATVTIPAGLLEATLTLAPIDDQLFEGDETVILTLSAPVGAVLGNPATVTVLIADNDALPLVGFATGSSTVAEAADAHPIVLQVDRPSTTPVVVTLAQSGTATVGSDVQAVAISVAIPAGATTAAVLVTILDDALPEPTETVVLTVTAATGATPAGTTTHTLSILDTDRFALLPILECVEDNLDGTFTAFFGYQNDGARIGLAPGPFNNVRAGADDQGQAVIIPPGRSGTWPDVALAMIMPGDDLTWHLGTATAAAHRDSPRPPAPPVLTTPPLPPVARIAQPASGTVVAAGAPVVVLVDSYDPDGVVRQVRLAVDGVDLPPQAPVPGLMTAFTLPGLGAGTHICSVVVSDDQQLTGSASAALVVGTPPTVTVADASPAPLLVGGTAQVVASPLDADGNLARVDFLQGDVLLGSALTAPYAITIPGITGNQVVTAVAVDATGLRASASLVLRPDRTPTVAITAPAAGALVNPVDGMVTLVAQASDPDGTVATVRFLVDGQAAGTLTVSPYRLDWPVGAATSLTVTAIATDDRGAVATASPVTVRINTPPTVAVVAPSDHNVVQVGDRLAVRVAAADADGTVLGLVLVQDGQRVAESRTGELTQEFPTDVPVSYVFQAEAFDDLGASRMSTPTRVRVNAPPVVAITAPLSGVAVQAGATVAALGTASDADGTIASAEWWLDGRLLQAATAPAAPTLAWVAEPGAHQLELRIQDNDGAIVRQAVTVLVNTFPTIAIAAPVDAAHLPNTGVIRLTARATDADGRVERLAVAIDGVAVADVAGPSFDRNVPVSGRGNHTVVVTATDNQGLVTTASRLITLVNVPPSVAITAPADGMRAGIDAPLAVTLTATDMDGSIAGLRLGVAETATGPFTIHGSFTASPATDSLPLTTPGATVYLRAEATDDEGAVGLSTVVPVVVNVPPVVALLQPVDGTVVAAGTALPLQVIGADADGQVRRLEVREGGAAIAGADTDQAQASFTGTWPASPGLHQVRAAAIDNTGDTGLSPLVGVRVDAPPTISWLAPAGGADLASGSPVSLTLAASDPDGGPVRVVITVDGQRLAVLDAAPYSLAWSPSGTGVATLVATATDVLGQSASATCTVTRHLPPTVAITAPVAGATVAPGDAVSITATASADGVALTGVAFLVDGQPLGTAAAAPYATTWTAVGVGSHVLLACATDGRGQSATAAPVSITIGDANALPVVAISDPVAEASLPVGVPATVAVMAGDADGSVTRVVLRAGTTVIGNATAAPWTFSWTPAAIGSVTLVAEATDDRGAIVAAAPVTVHVVAANTPPIVAIASPVGHPSVIVGVALPVTVTAADSEGTVVAVRFLLDDQLVTTLTTAPWQATITPATPGTHQLRAEAVDDQGAVGTSPPLTLLVEGSDPTPGDIEVVVTAPDDGTTVAQGATVRLTAEVFNHTTGITWLAQPPGAVNDGPGPAFAVAEVGFYVDGILVGRDPTEPYAIPWLATTTGSHVVVARAATTIGGLVSQPITVVVEVDNGQAPTLAITSPASDGAVVGIDDILGTVQSTNPAAPISRWELAMLDGSGSRLATVASATSAVTAGGVLGRLDTSLLRNGVYYLTLVADDQLGRQAQAQRVVRVEGEAKPGNFAFTVQDAAVEVEGLTLTIARSYDTLERQRSLDHGYGWRSTQSDLAIALSETREDVEDAEGEIFSLRTGGRRDVTLTLPDGRRATFYATFEPAGALPGIITQRPAWTASDAVQETLTFSSRGVSEIGGSDLVRTFVDQYGNPLRTYWEAAGAQSTMEGFDIPAWNLTQPDGTRYEIDREQLGAHLFVDPATSEGGFEEAFGKATLARIVRPNGDQVEFGAERIAHRVAGSNPRTVFLIARDTAGRIAQVWDPIRIDDNGAAVGDPLLRYTYDSSGDLVAVAKLADASVTPAIYETTRYYYEEPRFPHYLTRIVDPTGKTVLEAQYDAQGRLTGIKDATGTVTVIAHDITARREQVTDRTGRAKTLVYDAKGRVTDDYDGLGNHTHHEYDSRVWWAFRFR